uniref:Uncharacterized protein n=1 Tax=Cucumis melo TaxID=3656 RepID=A0A9I9DAW2_CUCME
MQLTKDGGSTHACNLEGKLGSDGDNTSNSNRTNETHQSMTDEGSEGMKAFAQQKNYRDLNSI